MVALAVTAKTFGTRPSALLAMEDPMLALELDLAAALALERERQESASSDSRVQEIWL